MILFKGERNIHGKIKKEEEEEEEKKIRVNNWVGIGYWSSMGQVMVGFGYEWHRSVNMSKSLVFFCYFIYFFELNLNKKLNFDPHVHAGVIF